MKSRLEQLLDELLRQIDIPAMEQAMSKQYKSQIRRRWELPADYWMLLERCCGLRTVWSNDTYEALELWGLDTLVKGQEGYAYNPVEQKVIKDWDEHLVVIASDAGDPYCLDLRRNDTRKDSKGTKKDGTVPGETRRKNRSIKAGHHKMGERLGIP